MASQDFSAEIAARRCKRLKMQGAQIADRRRHTWRYVEEGEASTLWRFSRLRRRSRSVVRNAV